MKRILTLAAASLASLGLALSAGSALAQKAEAPKAKTEAPKAAPAKPAEAPKADAPKGEPMDINSASEKELATLKGIGDVRAKAIVKHRPYKGKDDLVKKKIIPQGVYDDIKDQIIAKQDTAKPAEKKADAKKK
ncbi:MAG TPA: helix-hairpin-helix domain-containing protein [Usitatibacter sp.]|jgi:DNA uptake protein ComE-like DNA-binding protein|nr:helix-hairpin-helix domain-containing protein [Usitatibacter sp.]